MTQDANSLTLPGAFVLLLQKPNGASYRNSMAATVVVAAELGELALQKRVTWQGKQLHLADATPTGIARLDALLTKIDSRTGHGGKPIGVRSWVALRGMRGKSTLRKHRAILAEQQFVTREPHKLLGMLPNDRYVPDAEARDAVVGRIRSAAQGGRYDERTELLCCLVHASSGANTLGFDRDERAKLKEIAQGSELAQSVQQTVAVLTVVALAGAAASTAGS